jgi:hypothetical protein
MNGSGPRRELQPRLRPPKLHFDILDVTVRQRIGLLVWRDCLLALARTRRSRARGGPIGRTADPPASSGRLGGAQTGGPRTSDELRASEDPEATSPHRTGGANAAPLLGVADHVRDPLLEDGQFDMGMHWVALLVVR